jgi:hypothetical protein
MSRHYELKPLPDYGAPPTTRESCLWPLHKWGPKIAIVEDRYGYECTECHTFVAMPVYKYWATVPKIEESHNGQEPA